MKGLSLKVINLPEKPFGLLEIDLAAIETSRRGMCVCDREVVGHMQGKQHAKGLFH